MNLNRCVKNLIEDTEILGRSIRLGDTRIDDLNVNDLLELQETASRMLMEVATLIHERIGVVV